MTKIIICKYNSNGRLHWFVTFFVISCLQITDYVIYYYADVVNMSWFMYLNFSVILFFLFELMNDEKISIYKSNIPRVSYDMGNYHKTDANKISAFPDIYILIYIFCFLQIINTYFFLLSRGLKQWRWII